MGNHRIYALSVALVAVGATSASAAYFTTGSIWRYVGAECVALNGQNSAAYYSAYGRVYNDDPDSTRTFLCPAVNINQNPPGAATSRILWWVRLDKQAGGLQCAAFACDEEGDNCYSTGYSSPSGSGLTHLGFSWLNNYSSSGVWYLVCDIPRRFGDSRSGVVSYKVIAEIP